MWNYFVESKAQFVFWAIEKAWRYLGQLKDLCMAVEVGSTILSTKQISFLWAKCSWEWNKSRKSSSSVNEKCPEFVSFHSLSRAGHGQLDLGLLALTRATKQALSGKGIMYVREVPRVKSQAIFQLVSTSVSACGPPLFRHFFSKGIKDGIFWTGNVECHPRTPKQCLYLVHKMKIM